MPENPSEKPLLKTKDQKEVTVLLQTGHEPIGFEWEGTTLVFVFGEPESARKAIRDMYAGRWKPDGRYVMDAFRSVHQIIAEQREAEEKRIRDSRK